MKSLKRYFCSTIGRKQVIGLTGLGLSLFVLLHVAGNLLMFVSAEAYNMYSYNLLKNPLIYLAELGLLVLFVAHLGLALKISLTNYLARPRKYAMSASGEKATSPVTKSMWIQGAVILVFVVLHLMTFKFGPHYEVTYGDLVVRDLFRLVVEVFEQPGYVVWYLFSLVVLALHLSHGVASSIQTLGIHHPVYTPMVKKISWAFALFILIGFASQPIYVFFFHKG